MSRVANAHLSLVHGGLLRHVSCLFLLSLAQSILMILGRLTYIHRLMLRAQAQTQTDAYTRL